MLINKIHVLEIKQVKAYKATSKTTLSIKAKLVFN